LTITGGTVNFSTGNLLTADTFTQSGGTLTGSDDITVAGAATWSGGTHAGSGTTNFESALSIEGAAGKELGDFGATTGRTLNINAGATWTGTGFLRGTSDSVINNATGSTFDIQTDADIFSSTGGATFNNDGTVVKSVGTDVTSIGIVYNNSGTTTINSGTVELTNGGTHTGTFNGSGTLDFGGGTHDLETGTDVTVADVDVTSGAVNINSGVDYNAGNTDISFGTVAIASGVTATTGTGSQSGGTLTGEGIFTVTDAFTLSGGTQSGNGTTNFEGSLSIEGAAGKEWGDFNATSGRTFNINAGATWTGTGFLRGTSGSVINNATDSTFDIQTDADLFISTGGATFNNSGTLLKSFGETANNQATDIDTDFTNQGTVEVQQGVLDFGGGYTQTSGTTLLNGGSLTRSTFLDAFDIQGGSVTGFGTITGDIDNAGTVAPGVSVGDIGTLQLTGDYTETATASIDIEIASATSFDRFEIGGDAAFDGTLNVSVLNSFFPSIGDSFEVLTFGAATNTAGLDFTGLQISTLDAVDDTEGTDEDTAFSGDLFDNDTDTLFFDTTFSATNLTLDVDGDVKTITAIEGDTNAVGSQLTLASGALLTVNADGTFDYNPNGQFESLAVGETGTDSFTYTIEDSFGTVDTATVTVTIDGVNDAPVAVDDDFTTDEDVPLSDTVFTNDSDIDSTTLTATLLTDVSDGSLTLNADGSFSYTPDANFNGTDSFTYQISDGDLTDTATVSLTVNPVNDDPTAVDNTTSTPENTAVVIDVLSNDSDVDGDSLTTTAVGTAGNGSASINPDGTVTYTPDAGFSGTDSFTYTISDGNGGTDTAAVTVTVSATANQDPVANDDSFSTDEDTDLSGDVFADNGNGADSDPDGDTLTATVLSDVSNGSLTLNGDGSFSYTPDANFNGTDSFTYQISDGELTDSATVSIMVDPVNDAPEAADDSSNTPENTAVTINVLDNDTDLDGDSLSIATVGTAGNGSVVDNGDGTVTYTPDTDFSGTDSFTYEVSDGNGGTDTALVTVSVSNENGVPDAVDDTFSTDEDTPLSDSVLANDTDPDGDALTVSLLTDVSDGSLSLNADGSFSYTPNADFNGTDSFTYEVSDGALTDTATVNITVNPVNDDPTAVDNTTSTPENTAVVIDVLSNDSDVDGDTLTITAVVATGNGNTVANDDGTITYTPNPNFTGSDTFVYEISDGNGGTDTATVNIAVNPVGTGSDLDIGLYDAGSDTLITLIEEGDEILASTIAGKKVTLAAFVPDDSTFTGQVESMFLDLNEGEVTRRENAEPYALFGDSQGNFRGQTDPFFEGDNTIEFDLYSKNGLRGDLLGTVTRNFTVVDDISGSADLTVGLFDADSDTLITEIEDGDEILASTIADRNLTIAAFVPDHTPLFGQVESIVLNLNDGQVTRTENVEPYSLFSNQGDDFKGGGVGLLPEGDNAIAFELYAKNGARGDLLDTITRNFAVVDDGV
ncbi:MAG: beta strand repeat-containing protein, partial [Leptolyngbyaceae cyanobacterium]